MHTFVVSSLVLSLRRSGFDLTSICMGFEVDKMALGHAFLRVPWFLHASIIRQMVRIHLVAYHRRCINLNLECLKNKVWCLRINTNTAVLAELLKLWGEGRNLFLTIFIQRYNELLLCSGYEGIPARRLVVQTALSKFSCVTLRKYINYLW
jgi:hypothetical protein